uniref:Uncharacterized protein n=1 Tax=Globodera rostochiensis TaxID=31243 RepID=A0A914GV87_GLORO
MNELKRNSDKWQFLKHVDDMDELDRVRRQHQVQLQKENKEGIIYRCHGSAHCPYRMAFYHDENAIYILHSHSHDAVVPIVGRISDENLSGKRISAGSTGGRSNKLSKDCVDLDETDDAEDEDEIGDEEGKAKTGRGKDDGLEPDHEDGGVGGDDDQTEPEEDGNDQILSYLPQRSAATAAASNGKNGRFVKRRRVRDKTSKKYWLQLGKVMGDIDEVCRTLCAQHFVRKIGMTSTKKNKIWFKCPQGKCQYRTLLDIDERLLYCRSTHNHPVPGDASVSYVSSQSPASADDAYHGLGGAAAASSVRSSRPGRIVKCVAVEQWPDNFALVQKQPPPSSSPSTCATGKSSSSSSPNVYRDTMGRKWLLLAERVVDDTALARVCSVHQLKQLCFRAGNVYFRCARFGNACPYRAIWQRHRGLVYHRHRHYHRKLLGGSHKHSPEVASRPRRHSSANVLDSDRMPSDNSSAEQTAASFVDKLGKKWRFLAKLDGISMRRSADSSSTATLEQQLEQLCAERHLSRSRLSSSSSRIWLHCAQHRQLEVPCPYRVIVHVPEGTVFHRMRHNHPVPYNLSDTEKEDDQQKNSINWTPRRPNTRSSLKNGGTSEAVVAANVRTKRQANQSGPTFGVKTRSTAAVAVTASEGGVSAADHSPSDADVTLTMSSSSSSSLSSADEDEAAASGGVISFQSPSCTDDEDSDHSRRRPNTRLFAKKLCRTWPKSKVRAKRNAFVKARASISCGLHAEEQQPTSIAVPSSPSTPRIYKFSNRNWRFMADKIGDRKALGEFCRANMLRVAGGIITSNYRNRMLCVRNGCPFRALWLNQQGLAYGRCKHNHPLTKIRSVVKEEEMNDGIFKLADFVNEFEALALRQALYFRVENDVFVLMLRSEMDDQWFSRLLMLRDEHSAIRLAEFTGCQEEFNEKVEHWIKSDYAGPQQLMEALNIKCVEYFQQSQAQQQQQSLQS